MSSIRIPNNDLDKIALRNFREYLRIPSVQPNVNYDGCVKFLQTQAKDLDLLVQIHYIVPKKPIVILTWVGTEPTLPTILLNSHMDVVPVFENKWTHNPFGADIHDQRIIARGTQDMKSVAIQYLETVRRLKKKGVALKRTIHLSFMPDEEIGGFDGMGKFVHTEDFQKLNIGVALDEGMASPGEEFVVFNGERCAWNLRIHCQGNPGHGSLLLENTAGEKVAYILDKLFSFRRLQKQKLADNPDWTTGDVITLNLTSIKGGVQTNVIPPEFILTFDCRIPPESVNVVELEEIMTRWCTEAGPNVWIEYSLKEPQIIPTKFVGSNFYWVIFKGAVDKLGLKVKAQIFPGGTDSRHLRTLGIPVIGFSPINNTPVLLHDHEYLEVDTFLTGIQIYYKILLALGNTIKK